MYAPTQETVKNHPYKHYNKYELRLIFKEVLDEADYKKLSHFVYLDKPYKKQIPGTYSVYHMMPHGIAIATNALCINEWLQLHGLPVRPQKAEYTIAQKMMFNNNDSRIDTRTETSVNLKNNLKQGRPSVGSGNWTRPEADKLADIWNWYSAGIHVNDIAIKLGCTVANVYYHVNKYKKKTPNWKDEMQVDKP